ncbi:MAG: hypothetical protein DRI46_12715 [Chloroflexi bacterium]|nr:MAG: hypothetical protein DRI46_12715 [Chloroflexota bacterium]
MGKKFCEKTGAWLDGYLWDWMEHAKAAVAKKWDYVVLVDGVEGSGKSGLAMTLAYYLDPTLSVDNVVFTPEQFIKAVDNSRPGQAIVWDEFVLGGLSDDALKQIQTTIIKKLVTIRKKRLYIFLLIPYIFMLRPYFSVGRTRLLIHTYSPDGLKRGYFKLYSYDRKKDLFFKGKKFYDYRVPCTKRGEFGNAMSWPFLDWKEYEEKKDEATESIQLNSEKINDKYRKVFEKILVHYFDRIGVKQNEFSKVVGISTRTIQRILRESVTDDTYTTNNTKKMGGVP